MKKKTEKGNGEKEKGRAERRHEDKKRKEIRMTTMKP
jgi:hypothetical protein